MLTTGEKNTDASRTQRLCNVIYIYFLVLRQARYNWPRLIIVGYVWQMLGSSPEKARPDCQILIVWWQEIFRLYLQESAGLHSIIYFHVGTNISHALYNLQYSWWGIKIQVGLLRRWLLDRFERWRILVISKQHTAADLLKILK